MAVAAKARPKRASEIRTRIREQKTALIQDEILEVAARLIAERGFTAVTSDDISAEMGFTKSIIYYYFKNKNELLWKVFEKIDATYSESLEEALRTKGDPAQVLHRVIRTHCLNVLRHGGWAVIYHRDDHELTEAQRRSVALNKRRYQKKIEALYESGVRQGKLRKAPPTIAVSCLLGACNWAYTWYKPTGPLSAEEIAEAYADQLIGGVLA